MEHRGRVGAGVGALMLFVALGACKREPSFDERYASARKAINDKSSELDHDMARRAAEAKAIDGSASDAATESAAGKI